MTNFELMRKSPMKFHVINRKDDSIVGSISASDEKEAQDLLKCWKGRTTPAAKAGVPRVRLPAMSKKAILRGC